MQNISQDGTPPSLGKFNASSILRLCRYNAVQQVSSSISDVLEYYLEDWQIQVRHKPLPPLDPVFIRMHEFCL